MLKLGGLVLCFSFLAWSLQPPFSFFYLQMRNCTGRHRGEWEQGTIYSMASRAARAQSGVREVGTKEERTALESSSLTWRVIAPSSQKDSLSMFNQAP